MPIEVRRQNLSAMQIERIDRKDVAIKDDKIGALSWWIVGKLLRRKRIHRVGLKLFDKTVWFWSRVEGILPWRGLSLVAVAKRRL